jgi:transposase InsO family protein
MESVNGTLKVECVHGVHFETREQARQAIVEYIGYYNCASCYPTRLCC